jgi:hypothetical protein
MRHDVGIGDEHPWRIGMRAKHPDRLAGLHDQSFVGLSSFTQACGRNPNTL